MLGSSGLLRGSTFRVVLSARTQVPISMLGLRDTPSVSSVHRGEGIGKQGLKAVRNLDLESTFGPGRKAGRHLKSDCCSNGYLAEGSCLHWRSLLSFSGPQARLWGRALPQPMSDPSHRADCYGCAAQCRRSLGIFILRDNS